VTLSRRKRTTLKEVAHRAGVSPTTASFVLNETPGAAISAATRARVLDVARELDYLPSAAARSLVSGETKTLGLVMLRADLLLVDAFVPQLLYGLNHVARRAGYTVQVEGIDAVAGDDGAPAAEDDDPYLRMIQARGLDGLVVLDPRHGDANLARRIAGGTPIVTLGTVPGADPYRVVSDEAAGMRRAAEHLLHGGRRRVAHLTFSPRGRSGTDARLAGYRAALEGFGVAYDEALVEETGYSAASGADAMARLLARTPATTCPSPRSSARPSRRSAPTRSPRGSGRWRRCCRCWPARRPHAARSACRPRWSCAARAGSTPPPADPRHARRRPTRALTRGGRATIVT
jgi:LacI family transcriptional regulator